MSGPPGSAAQVDNIVLPGLVNGDLQSGYLDGWSLQTSGGVVFASAFTPALPLPGPLLLLLPGLGALLLRRA